MSALFGSDKKNKKKRKSKFTPAIMVMFLLFALTVCLYLTRLEAHTRADIFLPLDYHSILGINSSEGGVSELSDADDIADLLNTYYQMYAHQEGRPYTIRQDLLLSRLAYIKAPQGFRGETEGVTVRELCSEVERILDDTTVDAVSLFGRNRQEILDITNGIAEHSILGELVICDYITNTSGLAGYILEKDDEITMALRGTDDVIDILDSAFLLPFNLSVQYAPMRELLEKYGNAKRIWLTGHSKGGHNAIYAASIDSRCRATGFNSPGFGIFLTDAQHDGLDFGVNYVINGDITGFLLFHLERRIVLESTDSVISNGLELNNRHRLDNFFSIDDLAVAAQIQPLSIWSEWITQLLWLVLIFLAGYEMIKLLKKMCSGILKKGASGYRKIKRRMK